MSEFEATLYVAEAVRTFAVSRYVGWRLVTLLQERSPGYLIEGSIVVGRVFEKPRWRLW